MLLTKSTKPECNTTDLKNKRFSKYRRSKKTLEVWKVLCRLIHFFCHHVHMRIPSKRSLESL